MGLLAGHRYVTRAEWGATIPRSAFVRMPALPTPRLWVHHSADDRQGAAAVRAHEDYHVNTRGWRGIAYNFLVGSDGSIFEGRGPGIVGGATAGDNSTSHAICLLGNFETYAPSTAQWRALVDLTRHGRDAGWWVPTCGGHRDAPGASTACPGRHLYAQLPDLRREITSPATTPAPAPAPVPEVSDMYVLDCAGKPALVIGLGGVQQLTGPERSALKDVLGVPVKRNDDHANWDALWGLRTPMVDIDEDALAAALAAKLPPGTIDQAGVKAVVHQALAEVEVKGHLELTEG